MMITKCKKSGRSQASLTSIGDEKKETDIFDKSHDSKETGKDAPPSLLHAALQNQSKFSPCQTIMEKDAEENKSDDSIKSTEWIGSRLSDIYNQYERLRNELELVRRTNKDQSKKLKKLEEEKKHERENPGALEKNQDKHASDLCVLRRANKDQHDKPIKFEEERKSLNIKEKAVISNLDDESLGRYQRAFTAFFDAGKRLSTLLETKQDRLVIQIHEDFDMQKFFDDSYDAPKRKNNGSLLFYTLDSKASRGIMKQKNYYGCKIVNKWNVIFANTANVGNVAKKKGDTICAGSDPMLEFLSQCWKQMGSLKIWKKQELGKSKKGINLFETQDNGVVPIDDYTLRYKLKRAFLRKGDNEDSYNKSLQRAKSYYRAIGRIMLHSLANSYTISERAMPPFYQNWLLRGCSPKDSDYHNDDVLQHLSDSGASLQKLSSLVGKLYPFVDGTSEIVTAKTIFTKVIPEQYLDSRAQVFRDFQEGLTLDGYYSLCEFLRSYPLEVVQKVAFFSSHISAEDTISLLIPVYCKGWEQTDVKGNIHCIGTETDRIEHQCKQEIFFRDVLCKILTEKGINDEFKYLSLFVKYCIGYDYLPDRDGNPDFKIFVEFDFTELSENSCPVAHTCVNTLKLPGSLYTDGRMGFETQLDKALMI